MMERIIECLDNLGVKHDIRDGIALVEFWTDTAGQDVPTEFEFDGTPQDFVDQFEYCANNYDVDEEVELYVGMRGKYGVPDSIRTILADCEEAKDTLTHISKALYKAIS